MGRALYSRDASDGSPYFGVNVADVRRENYDAMFENIQQQVQGAELLLGGRLHLFSATDYGELRRVIFIFSFETFPDAETLRDTLSGLGADLPGDANEFPDIWTGSELWTDFVRLAEGYTWWVMPALPTTEVPQVSQ